MVREQRLLPLRVHTFLNACACTHAEHIGFTNKTCSKDDDLVDDPVGPILRDFSSSLNWKSWKIAFSDQTKESASVTIQNFYDSEKSQPRCNDHFISDFPDTCEFLSKDKENTLYMAEEPRKFKIQLAEDALDCINILDDSRPPGCPNLFSVSDDCDQLHVNLAAKDDGSGRQRWQLVKEQ